MSPSIRIDEDVYAFLQQHAEAFIDTPNTVLRRLLNLGNRGGEVDESQRRGASDPPARSARRPVRRKRARSSRRATPGTILPHEAYELPLLQALSDAGGQAPAKDVIADVGQRLKGRLTDQDLDRIPSGAIRWENRVQFARLRLTKKGLLAKDSPRGTWALTPDGERLASAG